MHPVWDRWPDWKAATVAQLSDPATTTLVLVSRPERSALREAERTRGELADLGVTNLRLALNGVFAATAPGDAVADALTARGREAVATMPAAQETLPRSETPFLPRGTVGLEALWAMSAPQIIEPPCPEPLEPGTMPPGLDVLVVDIAKAGHGVIMTMGKGGDGKTTIAAAIAVSLARRGHQVTLLTTDPAAHVADAVEGDIPGLITGPGLHPDADRHASRGDAGP